MKHIRRIRRWVHRSKREAILGGKATKPFGPLCTYWSLVRINSKRHNPSSKKSVRFPKKKAGIWLPNRRVPRRTFYRHHNIAGRTYTPRTVLLEPTLPFVIERINTNNWGINNGNA